MVKLVPNFRLLQLKTKEPEDRDLSNMGDSISRVQSPIFPEIAISIARQIPQAEAFISSELLSSLKESCS